MKAFISFVALSAIACGALASGGCESMHDSDSSTHHSNTSGGNGAFGESPAKPGSYGNTPADAPGSSSSSTGNGTTSNGR